MTRMEQVLNELERGRGTSRQLADRLGLNVSIVRSQITRLRKRNVIKASGTFAGLENVWELRG